MCLQDSAQVVESYKSGFEPPGDVEFEDYGQAMKRTVSETSLTNSRPEVKAPSKSKSKLWPFKKNKVTHMHNHICCLLFTSTVSPFRSADQLQWDPENVLYTNVGYVLRFRKATQLFNKNKTNTMIVM